VPPQQAFNRNIICKTPLVTVLRIETIYIARTSWQDCYRGIFSYNLILILKIKFFENFFPSAPQDIPRADEVKALIKDIWDLRISKLRSSMNEFVKSDSLHAKVNSKCLNLAKKMGKMSLLESYEAKRSHS